jgi:hypothetical protein
VRGKESRPVPVQSRIAALEKQAKHGVDVPGIDLGHPLGRDAVFGEITIGPVMKDHLRARPPELGNVGR